MREECISLFDSYIEWLKQRICVESLEDICEITTPFLDRHNDHLQIYVKKPEDGFLLTDDSYVINDLRLSGFEITTEERSQFFNSVLNGFGVHQKGNELFIEASREKISSEKALIDSSIFIYQ